MVSVWEQTSKSTLNGGPPADRTRDTLIKSLSPPLDTSGHSHLYWDRCHTPWTPWVTMRRVSRQSLHATLHSRAMGCVLLEVGQRVDRVELFQHLPSQGADYFAVFSKLSSGRNRDGKLCDCFVVENVVANVAHARLRLEKKLTVDRGCARVLIV